MKKFLLALVIALPSLFANAQTQQVQQIPFKSLVDLGVCHGSTEIVARFLDGDRLKIQQSRSDLTGKDHVCSKVREAGNRKLYICGTDSWAIHQRSSWDLEVEVNAGTQKRVVIQDTDGNKVFESVSCTPHNGWTIVH